MLSRFHRCRALLMLRRSLQIGSSFGRWFALRYLDRVNERTEDMFEVSSAQEDTVGTRPGVCEDCTSSFVTAGLPG